VLIPNSSFISDKVKNWTLRNGVRRLAIPIGTAYACDPRLVRATLLKVAHDNPDVLRTPEPLVELKEFGAASINFVLYAYIDDITQSVRVRTELSIAILDAFADAGIGIPFTATEVTTRNTDRLHDARADAPSLHDDTSPAEEQRPAIGRGKFPALPAAAD
jgi:potassium-dependent mechanosensitive channel